MPPGTYQLRLTAAQSVGAMTIYLRQNAAAATQSASQLDAAAVAAFFDAALPRQLAQYNISGAAVAVVKGGAILFAQRYGYADLATQQAAKLFTWTAVSAL